MACSGAGASPTASCDHILLPAKEWVHGKSRSPHSSSHRHKHTQQRGPPMTLLNHLFTNTIPLPPHHHIHFLNSKKMCRKIGHIFLKIYRVPILRSLQNIIPTIRQVEKNVSQNRTHFPQNLSHSACST